MEGTVRNLPLAGRLYIFWMHVKFLQRTQKFWVQDEVQDIFSKTSNTEGATQVPHTDQGQAGLTQVEINNMLKKGAMQQIEHRAGEF